MNRYDVTAAQFMELYRAKELNPTQVIDVRELNEWVYYHLDETTHIPLSGLPERLDDIRARASREPVYFLCAHGVRSVAACDFFIAQGISNVKNVMGGMAAVSALNGFQYD